MIPSFIDKSKIPHKSGVYIFKDENKKVLYVGKAIDLYHRVASYFNGNVLPKTRSLAEKIRDLETITVESELEALVLEANLIKKYHPPFNVRLVDDKDYLYIAVTGEEFPRITTARKKDLKRIKSWYGPFPSSKTVKETLKRLRRVFPWCSNPPGRGGPRACFYYHIGLCPGACAGVIGARDYKKNIRRFESFLSGKKDKLLNGLVLEMGVFSKNMQFEEAQKIKKIILGINYLTQTNRVSNYLENPNFLEQENLRSLNELQKILNLPSLPERIEAYDISNIQGKEATGSMVVLTNGEIDKSQYRLFKIKISGRPNDVGMHREMIKRRLKHPEWPAPGFVLVDGGRGQAKAVKLEIRNFSPRFAGEAGNFEIPVYGLAKRFEWLYPPEGAVIKLPKRSPALRLLMKIRDESHRFAVTYHRKLRSKKFNLKNLK